MTGTGSFTVFYDGACPLCRKEIGFYQRQKGAEQVHWQDVSESDGGDVAPGLSCQAALAKFHVMTADGRLLQGGEAFAALWTRLPRFRWLGRIGMTPPFRWLLNLGYSLFLPVRPFLQRLAGSPR